MRTKPTLQPQSVGLAARSQVVSRHDLQQRVRTRLHKPILKRLGCFNTLASPSPFLCVAMKAGTGKHGESTEKGLGFRAPAVLLSLLPAGRQGGAKHSFES